MGYAHLNCLLPSPSSGASLVAQLVKNLPAMQETPVRFLGQEDSPGEGIGCPLQYSWTFLVAQTVKNPSAGFDPWIGKIPWRRARNPLQYSCLENPGDRGAWRDAIYGVEQGRTRRKRRNSSSSNERSEREIKETILFIITSKRMKYLGINLLKDLCSENYKILMKEIKK